MIRLSTRRHEANVRYWRREPVIPPGLRLAAQRADPLVVASGWASDVSKLTSTAGMADVLHIELSEVELREVACARPLW